MDPVCKVVGSCCVAQELSSGCDDPEGGWREARLQREGIHMYLPLTLAVGQHKQTNTAS